MSYMYYSVVGALVTVSVGCIVSLCTASDSDKYDRKLVHPMILRTTREPKEGKVNLCSADICTPKSSKSSNLVGIVNPIVTVENKVNT